MPESRGEMPMQDDKCYACCTRISDETLRYLTAPQRTAQKLLATPRQRNLAENENENENGNESESENENEKWEGMESEKEDNDSLN